MVIISKKDRKALRHWATIAYDRELGSELATLGAAIEAWRTGKRSSHGVADQIHQFHDGVARDLFIFYTRVDPASAVAHAVVAGIISEPELPPELLATLRPLIESHRWQTATQGADESDPDGESDSLTMRTTTAVPQTPRFTRLQGQYLAFIDAFATMNGVAPAEADFQRHFGVTPPTVHQMILTLERRGLISRVPGQARSIALRVHAAELPNLERLSIERRS